MYNPQPLDIPLMAGQTTPGVAPIFGQSSPTGFNLDYATGAGLGAGLGALLGGIGQTSPAESARPYMEQIAPTAEAGERAIPTLEDQYSRLLSDPGAVMGDIGAGFQRSPGYEWELGQALRAANQAASAGGMLGSPQAQQEAAEMATGLASKDYYDYMDRALNLFGTGVSGTQGLMQTGAGASGNLAESIANALASQAQLEYAGQVAENQARGGLGGTLGSLAGGVAGLLF
jgi:hypothetical protein